MKLCMIGTGYVGLVSGVCFSDVGNTVYCVDKDKKKINLLKIVFGKIYLPITALFDGAFFIVGFSTTSLIIKLFLDTFLLKL